MGAEQWSMGEEALVKEWWVSRRESTTFVRVFKNCIALKLSQIQPVSWYFDSAYRVPADHPSKQ